MMYICMHAAQHVCMHAYSIAYSTACYKLCKIYASYSILCACCKHAAQLAACCTAILYAILYACIDSYCMRACMLYCMLQALRQLQYTMCMLQATQGIYSIDAVCTIISVKADPGRENIHLLPNLLLIHLRVIQVICYLIYYRISQRSRDARLCAQL